MDIKVVYGVNNEAKEIQFAEFYKELGKIDIPEVSIQYSEYTFSSRKEIFIESFDSFPQGSGYGTKAMEKIIEIANKFRIIMSLNPSKVSTDNRVTRFWEKLGVEQRWENNMYGFYYKVYDGYEKIEILFRKEVIKNNFFTKIIKKLKDYLNMNLIKVRKIF